MPLGVQCPNCGKKFAADQSAELLFCAACGTRFSIAPAEDDPLLAAAEQSRSRLVAPKSPRKRRSAVPLMVWGLVTLGAGIGVVAWAVHLASGPPAPAQGTNENSNDRPNARADQNEITPSPSASEQFNASPTQPEVRPQAAPAYSPPSPGEQEQSAVASREIPPAPRQQGTFPQPKGRASPVSPTNTEPASSADLDGRIGQAMQKAVDQILAQFAGGQLIATPGKSDAYRAGLNALCIYALLQASQSLPDQRLSIRGKVMPPLIEALKKMPLISNPQIANEPITYAHSLRAAALAVFDRNEDQPALKADVQWLVQAQINGSYTYDDRYAHVRGPITGIPWDNSNSQYGLLGVWAAAEQAIEVPTQYWRDVDRHWKTTQLKDGQWRYSDYQPNVSLAMNCAGIASLMVTHDYIDAPMWRGAVGRDPFPGQLGLALRWLETGDNSIQTPTDKTFYFGYDLYGLERVGLATGLKFFDEHDWYRELAEKALKLQWADGGFHRAEAGFEPGFSAIDTAYVLLFLARGRFPILMDKLRFERFWSNRPRDIANLTRFVSRELERPFNWQVVNVNRPWYEWFDSPVLYIASHQPPALTDTDYAKLRSFVLAGGLIFTHADAGSNSFNQWVPEMVKRVCPEYELQTLPDTHLLYSTLYRVLPPHPKLLAVGNGSRLLVIHSPTDLAAAWQARDSSFRRQAFQMGANVFVYAAGKRDFRNRVQTPYVPDPPAIPARSVAVARLKYAGNWDPEPYAWKRLSTILARDRGEGIDLRTVDIADLKPASALLAHLTGTAMYDFTEAQIAALKAYVNSGGILLIDSCGGANAFADSVARGLLDRAFAGVVPQPLAPDHPLYTGFPATSKSLCPLRLRAFASDKLAGAQPAIQLIHFGEGYVIITRLDLTTGLLGCDTWGILGYAPASCEQFTSNVVTWCQAPR